MRQKRKKGLRMIMRLVNRKWLRMIMKLQKTKKKQRTDRTPREPIKHLHKIQFKIHENDLKLTKVATTELH